MFWLFSRGLLLALLISASLLPAQESVALDPVAVTARRTEQVGGNAPPAVTVYAGDFLAANGITGYEDLARIVPGLFVSEQSVENVSLNLRGVTSDSNDPQQQARVSVFQDGVVLANTHGNGVALFDLADVAVFKGPQPTQFGRGVEGGALALTSHRAVNASSTALVVTAGDYRAAGAGLTVNRPVVAGKFFARVAVQADRRDGYVENLADGADLQGIATLAVRPSLRWQPAAATTVDLIFNLQRDDAPGVAVKTMAGVPGLPAVDTNPYAAADLNRGAELGVTRTITALTGVVSHQLNDTWSVTATSGWRELTSRNEFDADGTTYYLIEGSERFHTRQLSQEIRFNYDAPGRLTASAGAAVIGTKDEQAAAVGSDENALWQFFTRTPPPVAFFNPRYAEQSEHGAEMTAGDLFGRADYQFTDRLTLGAGVRFTQERLVATYRNFPAAVRGNLVGLLPTSGGSNNLFKDTNGTLEQTVDDGSWSGQLEARYALTPRATAYAALSRGRRPLVQGFNLVTLAPEVHAEESVCNYEAGFRGGSADRRVRYSASVFQYEFAHFQTNRAVSPGVIQPYDGGRARGRGAEATVQADLAQALTVFATYGFTDARFAARDDNGAPQLYAGNTFRLTSRHVVSLGGTAVVPAGRRGTVFFTPLLTYRSAYFFEDDNAQNGGILQQGGHALLNLQLGYRPRRGGWEVAAYASNLLDKAYLLDAGNIGGAYGIPTSTRAAPRMLGVRAAVQF